MKGKAIDDLEGMTFGKLQVLRKSPIRKNGHVVYECQCDCGKKKIIAASSLVRGHTKSCGCIKKQDSPMTMDMVNKRFGKLVVVKKVKVRGITQAVWECECDCGNVVNVRGQDLREGKTRSCGCLAIEMRTKHGHHAEKLYSVWSALKDRCNNSNNHSYNHYGGRGICYIPEWDDYSSFREWALNNGYEEGLSIDRIDNNGNYEPSNCRWVDRAIQNRNKRNNIQININGETKVLADWCDYYGISRDEGYRRFKKGIRGRELFKPVAYNMK